MGRRARAVRSDAPRRQPVFTRHRPASALAQHAAADQPLQPTRRPDSRVRVRTGKPALTPLRRGGSLAPTGCPHPFVAGWASCCAGRAGHRRCRPPCTRCTRRSSCTRVRSACDRLIASRRHASAVDTCHVRACLGATAFCVPSVPLARRATLQAPRPMSSADLHTLARAAYRGTTAPHAAK